MINAVKTFSHNIDNVLAYPDEEKPEVQHNVFKRTGLPLIHTSLSEIRIWTCL